MLVLIIVLKERNFLRRFSHDFKHCKTIFEIKVTCSVKTASGNPQLTTAKFNLVSRLICWCVHRGIMSKNCLKLYKAPETRWYEKRKTYVKIWRTFQMLFRQAPLYSTQTPDGVHKINKSKASWMWAYGRRKQN